MLFDIHKSQRFFLRYTPTAHYIILRFKHFFEQSIFKNVYFMPGAQNS